MVVTSINHLCTNQKRETREREEGGREGGGGGGGEEREREREGGERERERESQIKNRKSLFFPHSMHAYMYMSRKYLK